jgi:phosphoglycolate phosphatase-like HAD superfamily hydrolase
VAPTPEGPSIRLAGAIFDLDGTLADTLQVCFAAFRGAFARLGAPVYTDEQIRALFGPSEDGMMQRAIPDRWQAAVAAYLEEYERHLPVLCAGLFPAVAQSLALLRARAVPTALVTGKGAVSASMSLRHFRLDDAFDAVESGSARGVVKADAIRRVVKRWDVEPARVIYAGDAGVDMAAAREAGVLAVGAAWAPSFVPGELDATQPHVIFTTADDFHRWLDSVTQGETRACAS